MCYFFGNKTCFLSLFSNQGYDGIDIYKMGNLTNYVSGGGESPGFSVTFSINGCRLCKGGMGGVPGKGDGSGNMLIHKQIKI